MDLQKKNLEPNKHSMWRGLIGSPAVQQTVGGLLLTGLILAGASIARCSQSPDRETLPRALKGADAENTFGTAMADPKSKQGFSRLAFMAACGRDTPVGIHGYTVNFMCLTPHPLNAVEQETGFFQTQPGA